VVGTTLGDVTARPPPAVVVDNAARLDGGTSPGSILVPIHVVDRAESATASLPVAKSVCLAPLTFRQSRAAA
jgi:hypothetical protein